MVQFLSVFFFSWISSIFVGFFKSSRFFVSPCTYVSASVINGTIFGVGWGSYCKQKACFDFLYKLCLKHLSF